MVYTNLIHLTNPIAEQNPHNKQTRAKQTRPPQHHRIKTRLEMISDTTLTNLSNGLGVTAMLLIVAYHFVAVNGKRASQ